MRQFKYFLARVAVPFVKNAILGKEIQNFINQDGVLLLDVRTEEEWEENHIPCSIHMDYFSDSFFENLKTLDRNKEYIVYCSGGIRSAGAIVYMKMLSFPNIINVQDGIDSFFDKQGDINV